MRNGGGVERGLRVRVTQRPHLRSPEEVEGVFEHETRGLGPWAWRRRSYRPRLWQTRDWVPRMDAFRREGKIIVLVDLPGMKREDIEVTVEGDILMIRGRRHEEQEIKEEDYYCCERAAGEFSRAISLPERVSSEAIEVVCQDGVLEVAISLPETKKGATRAK